MTQDGFQLDLPDGTTYAVTEQVDYSVNMETQFFTEGLGQIAAFYQQFIEGGGQSGVADSNFQTVTVGVGSGIHRITLTFLQYIDSGDSWGSLTLDGSETARSILQELQRDLSTTRIDSTTPATLSVNEYSDSGRYDPIPVVVETVDLPHTTTEDQDRSGFQGTLTLIEATNLGSPIDNQRQRTDR